MTNDERVEIIKEYNHLQTLKKQLMIYKKK